MMLAVIAASPVLAMIPAGPVGLAIWIIIVLAVVAIVYIAARAMGVPIPQWVVQVIGIVIIAVVCIVAIKFLVGVL